MIQLDLFDWKPPVSKKYVLPDGVIEWRNSKGQLHREDGPAVECPDGSKYWYLNGLLHKEDGPAVIDIDTAKNWYFYGLLHRTDGPAIEYADGTKSWYLNGKRHREDGPAVEWKYNTEYWLNNIRYSETEYKALIKSGKWKENQGETNE